MNLGVVWTAVVLVAGLVWCGAIMPRWREDLAAIQDPKDPSDRSVALLLWGVTAIALVFVVNIVWGILSSFFG